MGLISFLLHYCIVTQAIWFLKFLKHGKIWRNNLHWSPLTPRFRGLVLPVPRDLRLWVKDVPAKHFWLFCGQEFYCFFVRHVAVTYEKLRANR